MRIVYDDAMQRKLCILVENFMCILKDDIKSVVRYDYGMNRVQANMVKQRLNRVLADWYIDHGFNVDIEVKDVDYITKGSLNYRSMTLENAGNKRTLRNRTVMTITW